MATINVSIPDKLKEQAQLLIKAGLYVSFSDLVRDSVRQTVKKDKNEILLEQAIKDDEEGKTIVLESDEDIDNFINKL